MKRIGKKGLSILVVALLAFGLGACHASYNGSIKGQVNTLLLK